MNIIPNNTKIKLILTLFELDIGVFFLPSSNKVSWADIET